jgi:hypothetical protein
MAIRPIHCAADCPFGTFFMVARKTPQKSTAILGHTFYFHFIAM